MKLLQFGRSFGAAFALVLMGCVFALAATSPYWGSMNPSVTGAWLGDANFNIYTLWVAHNHNAGLSYTSLTTISQTSTQANCTQLTADGVFAATTSASTGYVCLPTAVAGKITMISNPSGHTID